MKHFLYLNADNQTYLNKRENTILLVSRKNIPMKLKVQIAHPYFYKDRWTYLRNIYL